MKYEIIAHNHVAQGAMLTINIPIEEVDAAALLTISKDPPDFLLPFRVCCIDAQVSITYMIENRTKIQFQFRDRSTTEYIQLWKDIFNPFIECRDWFMDPLCIVMDVQYMFYDKQTKKISMIYIPSTAPVGNHETMRQMATAITRENHCFDSNLENKVLRLFMEDFNIKSFLRVLTEYDHKKDKRDRNFSVPPEPNVDKISIQPDIREEISGQEFDNHKEKRGSKPYPEEDVPVDGLKWDDEPKKKWALFRKKTEAQEQKSRKRKKPKEVIAGAAVVEAKHDERIRHSVTPFNPAPISADRNELPEEDDKTVLEEFNAGTYLKLLSSANLPPIIPVSIDVGENYTIGRFDISVGRKLSNFEFDRSTRAVSRKHAVIERKRDGYYITDLASSAGTFVDGRRLQTSTPCKINPGSRISFGNAGAEYIWEEG